MSLQRGEGSHAKNLLTQIAQAFPQSIYYSLRTMVLCLREFAFKVVQVRTLIPSTHATENIACTAQALQGNMDAHFMIGLSFWTEVIMVSLCNMRYTILEKSGMQDSMHLSL